MSLTASASAPRLGPEALFDKIFHAIRDASDLQVAIERSYPDIVRLMDADRVTIYQRDRKSDDLVSRFKVSDQLKEIRVSYSTTSISGFCALSRQVINIPDVYDEAFLKAIHPNLNFQKSFDEASGFRTRAMLVVPILFHEALLGVLQIINRRGEGVFGEGDKRLAIDLARVLGQKLRDELQSTTGPYSHLVEKGRITQQVLDEVKARALGEKQTVSFLLMRDYRLTSGEIGASLEQFYQVPYMPYNPDCNVPKELFQGIKETYFRNSGWMPIGGTKDDIVVLIDDPTNSEKLGELQRLLNARKYTFRVGLAEDIQRFLGQEVALQTDSEGIQTASAVVESSIEDPAGENDPVVVQLVNKMLMQSYLERASDIHIEPSGNGAPTSIRFRIDGSCIVRDRIPADQHRALISRIKVLSKLDISEQRQPQDGKLTVRYKGAPLEFRVATIPTVHGESMVMRLLASAKKMMGLDELNIADHYHPPLKRLLAQPHGVFLVVGPTGSGKTTTLHALLHHLNTPDRKIWTAEDPVEITQNGLQQVQVQPKIGFTFAKAMRAFLRGDPDVIMVGEMRDQETAMIGIEASLTGHLVFSTLHSNSAPETLTRLIDLGVEKASFADALLGVMSQRLMRKLCSKCKKAFPLTPDLITELATLYGAGFGEDCGPFLKPDAIVYRHGGCAECQNTGFHGRMPIHELLVNSPDLKRLIVQNAHLDQLIEAARMAGMRTLVQDQIIKVFWGYLDVDEVLGALH